MPGSGRCPSIGKRGGVKPFIRVWIADVCGGNDIGKPIATVVYIASGGSATVIGSATGEILVQVGVVDYREWTAALRDKCS